MLTVACWLWSAPGSRYRAEHANALRLMVARHYPAPHRFVCVTSAPAGLDPGVEVVPDRADFAELASPHGAHAPSCYRRLRLFAPDAADAFGERVVSLDLDCVLLADMRPLWDRPEAFVAWRDPMYAHQLNGSMFLLRAGALPGVWADFEPSSSPTRAREAGYIGSDQGWMSFRLREASWPEWTRKDGVLSFRADRLDREPVPAGARAVFFHGRVKPWEPEARRLGWIRENWRG